MSKEDRPLVVSFDVNELSPVYLDFHIDPLTEACQISATKINLVEIA